MKAITGSLALTAFIALLTACGGGDADAEIGADVEEAADAPAGGMGAMDGMGGMDEDMMQRMRTHMRMMGSMSGDSMMSMMSTHRQMVANMIAQFNREMADMNMATDAEWNALVDSLRLDLTRMPEMSMAEMQALMPEHHARVRRLMDMHETMMAEMRPAR